MLAYFKIGKRISEKCKNIPTGFSFSDALSAIHLSNQRFLEYKKPYQQVCDLFCGALMAYFVEVSQVYCIRLFYIAPLFELIFFFFISVIGRLWGTTFMETSILYAFL